MQAGKRTKWDAKREASYAALVGSAMRCFHEHGYAATTVAKIVEGTGYTSGAFYFHFADKADCFWSVIEHRARMRGEWWPAVLEGLSPEEHSLEEALRRVDEHLSSSLEGLDSWTLVMVDFQSQHRSDPEALRKLAEVYQGWHEELTKFVHALQEAGWVDRDRDAAQLATEIFAYTEGLTTHAQIYAIDEQTVGAALFDGLARLLR